MVLENTLTLFLEESKMFVYLALSRTFSFSWQKEGSKDRRSARGAKPLSIRNLKTKFFPIITLDYSQNLSTEKPVLNTVLN